MSLKILRFFIWVLLFAFSAKGAAESFGLKEILPIKQAVDGGSAAQISLSKSSGAKKPPQLDPFKSSAQKKLSIRPSLSPASKKKPSVKKKRDLAPLATLAFLKDFSENHTALEIHNKALSLLQNQQKDPALLLLKRNAYRNLFLPSGFLLIRIGAPIDFAFFLWHIAVLLSLSLSAGFLFLAFKRPADFWLKVSAGALALSASMVLGLVFMLKQKAYPLNQLALKAAPFVGAPMVDEKRPLSELTVIKQMGEWLLVRDQSKQEGWVHKSAIFIVF